MTDLLDPSALLHVLQQLLPPIHPTSTTSSSSSSSDDASPPAQLGSPADALSALIHTVMTRLDFRLTGLSDDDRSAPSSSSDALSSNQLPASWNANAPDHYCFRYKHHQSSLDYVVKVVKLGNKAVIHGIALQGSKTSTLEIPLADYFSPSFFPYPHRSKDGERAEPLVNGFIGSSRLKDLVGAFKTQILQTLVPGLNKEGYIEHSAHASSSAASSASAREARAPRPRPPLEGDPDDPSQTRPRALHPDHPPWRHPYTVGDRDLDPLGGSPLAFPPRFGGGGGDAFAPPPLFGDTGGGMYVGPNHPMFRHRFPPGPSTGLPPGAVPPGARFDPIYPTGPTQPPFHPRTPDVGGAHPQPPFAAQPDWDDFPPPRPRPDPDTQSWYS